MACYSLVVHFYSGVHQSSCADAAVCLCTLPLKHAQHALRAESSVPCCFVPCVNPVLVLPLPAMGVTGLWQILEEARDQYGRSTVVRTLAGKQGQLHEIASACEGKRIAIDLSVWLCQVSIGFHYL